MQKIGFDFGFQPSRGGGAIVEPSPVDLFSGDNNDVYWNATSLDNLASTTSGTGAVTDGSVVRYAADLSGAGNHATAITAGGEPTVNVDGSGYRGLIFDGVNDWMGKMMPVATAHPWTRVSLVKVLTYVEGRRIFGTTGGTNVLQFYGGGTQNILMSSGLVGPFTPISTGAWLVLTEIYNGPNSKLAVDNGAYATGDPGANNSQYITMGGNWSGANPANVAIGAMWRRDGLATDDEIAYLRTYFGSLVGKAL